MDIRLQSAEYEIGGVKYKLICNMNVLADLQEKYGDIKKALDKVFTLKGLLFIVACMANEDIYQRNKQGEGLETLTARDVGAGIGASTKDVEGIRTVVLPLLTAALKGDEKNA